MSNLKAYFLSYLYTYRIWNDKPNHRLYTFIFQLKKTPTILQGSLISKSCISFEQTK